MYTLISTLLFTFACDPQSKTDPGTDPNTLEDSDTPNPEGFSVHIWRNIHLVEVEGIDMDSMYLNISEDGDYMSFGLLQRPRRLSRGYRRGLFFDESGTEMACSDEDAQVDGWLSDFFESNPTYTFDGSILNWKAMKADSRWKSTYPQRWFL